MKQGVNHVTEEQLLATFQAQDWNVLWPQLQAHAVIILRGRYKVFEQDRIKELSRKFVSEILDKVLLLERKWYPHSNVEFYDFLTSALDSHINAYWKKEKGNLTSSTDDKWVFESNTSLQKGVEESMEVKELKENVISQLRAMGADDDEELVFDCMADGLMKPKEIQNELGISPSQTNTILRRLRRKLDIIRIKLFVR